MKTPDGELTQQRVCHRGDQPATSQKLIKSLSRDFRTFRHTQAMPKAIDRPTLELFRRETHTRGYAFGLTVTYPGFHMWEVSVQGGVEALTYAELDTPEVLREWFELDMERGTRLMELALQADLDYLLFGGSGTVTMASPALAAKYAIPALKKWSRIAKGAVEATRDAGAGGGFILSIGDQCGRDTPEASIFAVVEAAEAHGRYDPTSGALPDLP